MATKSQRVWQHRNKEQNMNVDCDCNGNPQHPLINDHGITASTDPVALDQACLDVVFNYDSKVEITSLGKFNLCNVQEQTQADIFGH